MNTLILNEISEKLQRGKAKDVAALVTQALEEQLPAGEILNEGLVAGMNIIGAKFQANEVFVPEVLVAARAMNKGTELIKPLLAAEGNQPIGKACIGTVQGDLHDIGKNIVKLMLESQNIDVIDLGVDVPADKFIEAMKANPDCKIVALSALLTTTMPAIKNTIDAIVASGLRDTVKIMIGGAPVTQAFADEVGADGYSEDAASAAELAQKLIA